MGILEYEAKRYEGRVKDGGILVSIHCGSSEEVSRAKDILKATGAEDIASSGEKSITLHGVETDRRDTEHVNTGGLHTNRLDNEGVNRDVIIERDVVVDRASKK